MIRCHRDAVIQKRLSMLAHEGFLKSELVRSKEMYFKLGTRVTSSGLPLVSFIERL